MDPNATLAEIRQLVTGSHPLQSSWAANEWPIRLANLVRELDEWLSKGGFLPSDWEHSRVKPPF